ncbi:uncharacterized protein DEA37_0006413 [Paragonimus westermani]|uniref:Reverse transcriptase domain-containing protein n=1 Tax=Paragonimus westermani TaxID=34504 RepID=A0A5J4NBP8_9TREM|nr:uncharacterized protein DEA37_0006413 [Paragonimus westermani]
MLDNVITEVVDRFVYLGSCISGGGGVGNEIEARISKARTVFASLGHLWRQGGISLKLKGRVYKTSVRAVLLYCSETWPLRVEDVNRLQVVDHRCLRSVVRIGWHQRDVIEEANSPYNSPVLLVKKSNGKYRFCVDFRRLNEVTQNTVVPIPSVADIFDKIQQAKLFTVLDLRSGYWQVPIKPTDREKTAFTVGEKQYQFERMPFGLSGAPSTFRRLMVQLVKRLDNVAVYGDDIVIYSNTESEHQALTRSYSEPTAEVEAEAIRENQQVIDRAEQTVAQQRNQRSLTGNSSAGLILSVPQPSVPISSAPPSGTVTKSHPLVQTAFNGASMGLHLVIQVTNRKLLFVRYLGQSLFSTGFCLQPRSVQSQSISEPLGGFSTDPFSPRSPNCNSTTRSDATDPFANFAPATTAISTSGAKQSSDFFADFSSASVSLSTHSIVPQVTAISSPLQPPVIPESVWSDSLSNRNFQLHNQVQKTTTSTADKYAALAELDGLFKSTTSAPSGVDARGLFASNPPPSYNPIHTTNYYSPASNAFSSAFDAQHPSKTYNPFLATTISMNATPKHHNTLNPFTNPPPQSFTSPLSTVPVSNPSAPIVTTNRNPFVLTTKQPQLSNHVNPFFQQSQYSSSSGTRSFPASWMTQQPSGVGPVTSANDGLMSSTGTAGFRSTAQPVPTRAFPDFVPF